MDLCLFGEDVSITVSVVAGSQTPFLLSKAQLSFWKAVIDVEDNTVVLTINGKNFKYNCPRSGSNLMILPLIGVRALGCPVPTKDE